MEKCTVCRHPDKETIEKLWYGENSKGGSMSSELTKSDRGAMLFQTVINKMNEQHDTLLDSGQFLTLP